MSARIINTTDHVTDDELVATKAAEKQLAMQGDAFKDIQPMLDALWRVVSRLSKGMFPKLMWDQQMNSGTLALFLAEFEKEGFRIVPCEPALTPGTLDR